MLERLNHLCVFGSTKFLKAVVFIQLCPHAFALLSLTRGSLSHLRSSLESVIDSAWSCD